MRKIYHSILKKIVFEKEKMLSSSWRLGLMRPTIKQLIALIRKTIFLPTILQTEFSPLLRNLTHSKTLFVSGFPMWRAIVFYILLLRMELLNLSCNFNCPILKTDLMVVQIFVKFKWLNMKVEVVTKWMTNWLSHLRIQAFQVLLKRHGHIPRETSADDISATVLSKMNDTSLN